MTEGEESCRSQAGQLRRLQAAGKGKRGCQKQEELKAPGSVSGPAPAPCGAPSSPGRASLSSHCLPESDGAGRGIEEKGPSLMGCYFL